MRNADCGIEKAVFRTSLGWVGAAVTERGICRVVLPKKDKQAAERELGNVETVISSPEPSLSAASSFLAQAITLLQRYLSGKRVTFDLPLDLRSYTIFQQAVWQAAGAIPYGETRPYSWVAKRIGSPKAVRAVGQALGANPVPLIIPCHRVISSAGTLGGFSGGPGMKGTLIELEKRT